MMTEHIPASEQVIDNERAADGGRMFPAANSLADFMRFLEDGQFDADVTTALCELNAQMEHVSQARGGGSKVKGKVVITVDLVRETEGHYMLSADFTVKPPKEPRPRSVAWLTPDNRFTPNKPNQGSLFGTVRDVSVARNIRN